jgi:type II secretory pathway pseudopilin PulG
MKTSILLKLLQHSAVKTTPNFNNTARRKKDAGFTILELLVIVILLGTLAAIAAPGWLGFINRQRVRTVNDRVLQSLRTAQSEAKRSKRDIIITFNTSDDPPTATIKTEPTQNPPLQALTFNGGGEIKRGQLKTPLSVASCPNGSCTAAPSITFNYNGLVDPNNTNNPDLPFVVTVSPAGGGTKQCVIVDTILGSMRTAEGEYNNTTKDGCPALP